MSFLLAKSRMNLVFILSLFIKRLRELRDRGVLND